MVEFQNGEIDPVKYGVLWERVQHMDRKITKMEGQLDELIALANKGKGGLWFGMTVASAVSGFIGFALSNWKPH
jgi:hypothetical protein